MRITLRLAAMCSLVLFAFQVLATAQTQSAAAAPPLLKISIAIDPATLSRDKPAIVTIAVENTSGEELEISSNCFFNLKNLSKESLERKHQIVGDRYWGPVNVSTGMPTDLTIVDPVKLKKGVVVGKVPKPLLTFAKDETKTFKFDLTRIFWNDSMRSMWPHETLFQVVPNGTYALSLDVKHQRRIIESNAVQVSVK